MANAFIAVCPECKCGIIFLAREHADQEDVTEFYWDAKNRRYEVVTGESSDYKAGHNDDCSRNKNNQNKAVSKQEANLPNLFTSSTIAKVTL